MTATPVPVLVIGLDDRRYGIAADDVIRVVRMVAMTPLPGAPDLVPGVINIAGSATPVFDARFRLGHERRAPTASDHLVITRAKTRSVALWIDRALSLVRVAVEPLDAGSADMEHIAGVGETDEGLLVITDVSAFLSLADQRVLDSAMAAPR